MATPDPRHQPYRIEVVLSGIFVAGEGVTEAELTFFAQNAVPTILWPYVREAVYRITQDARYGPTRLDPINVSGVLAQPGWEEVRPAPSVPIASQSNAGETISANASKNASAAYPVIRFVIRFRGDKGRFRGQGRAD